ncbi:Ger(x)C family spore germination protein [Sporosarcina beigongshangi]|uniref:Ger(x)C family spore germination protein n=1 Tax=Sporosarcina beigongshangi TaxID=2782538 RepID=UPI00193A9F13|nr:Ger(x)C family spore germination protein [Sporosarcina beigongshangi]
MSRKQNILFAILFIVTLLSGCSSQNEPERMLYIHGIGIDYEDNMYTIYAQVINFSSVAKSEQPGSESEPVEVGKASGKTVDEAVFNLYRSLDQKLFWGHLTFVVYSEEAMKKGRMNTVIDLLSRYRETRYRIWFYSTEDSVKDVLLIVPIINTSLALSRLGDPRNSYTQESFVEPVNMRMAIIGLNEPNHEAVIPAISVVKDWETAEGKDDIAKVIGVGVVSRDGFKGFITGDKARGLRWMNNKMKRTEISLDTGEGKDRVTVTVEKIKVHVDPVVEGDSVGFDINIKMTAEIASIQGKVTIEEIRKQLEEEVKREIKETYEEALKKDIDIYRLSEYLYRKNVKAWKRAEQDGKVELSDNSIGKLDIKIKEIKSGRKSFKETLK